MKVIFFGASKFVIPILQILRTNFDLTLVLTTEKEKTEAVPSYCLQHNIKFFSTKKLSEPTIRYTLHTIRSPLAVLAYFGLILPKEVLDIFPMGVINIHPSMLPKYRGPTPVQTTILNGDTETGVTIIKLDEQVDHGPILAQKKEPVLPDDTTESLHHRLFTTGASLCSDVLIRHYKGELSLIEQDHSKATFTEHLTRENGFFDSNNPPSKETLDKMIRAYYPWPGVWTRVIVGSDLVQGRTLQKEKIVKLLPNKMIQVEGKKPMSYKDFINGYPKMKSTLQKLTT